MANFSCIAINFLKPKANQNMLYLSPYHRPVQNSAKMWKFRGNGQILWLDSKFCIPRKTGP